MFSIIVTVSDERAVAPRVLGCCTVRLRAHLLPACHVVVDDVERTSSKCQLNQMMFVWLPLSTWWRRGCDTVLMHRLIQDDTFYMCEKCGADRKLHVEVIRTSCFMAKDGNWPHHHAHHVWRWQKLLITFHLHFWEWYWLNVKSVVWNL